MKNDGNIFFLQKKLFFLFFSFLSKVNAAAAAAAATRCQYYKTFFPSSLVPRLNKLGHFNVPSIYSLV